MVSRPGLAGPSAFVALTLTWGVSFALIAVALEAYTPLEIAGLRLLLAGAVLVLPAWRLYRRGGIDGALIRRLVPLAALGNIAPFYLIAFGERFIDSGIAGVLIATTPVWTVLLHWGSASEAPTRWLQLSLSLLGLVGVAIILGAGLGDLGWDAAIGGVPLVAAALCYALAFRIAGRVQRETGLPSLTLASLQLWAATVLILPALLGLWAWNGPPAVTQAGPLAALVVLAVVSTGAGYVLYHRCIALIGPSRTSMINVGMPLVSFVLGAAWLGEVYGMVDLVGAVLIVSSLLGLLNRRPATAVPAGPTPRSGEAPSGGGARERATDT